MYQTDLTEIEWQYMTKVLNLQERKRKYDLRMIWNAIFYLVKTGCQWRMLLKEFPKWESVIIENGLLWIYLICFLKSYAVMCDLNVIKTWNPVLVS